MTPKSSTRRPSSGRRTRPALGNDCLAQARRLGEHLVVVLADPRGAATGPHTPAVDLREARRRVGRDPTRELGAGDGAAGTVVLGRQHVGGRQDGCDGHAPRLALQRQLVLVALAEELLEGHVQPVGRKRPATNRLELRILQIVRLTQPRAHRVPLPAAPA